MRLLRGVIFASLVSIICSAAFSYYLYSEASRQAARVSLDDKIENPMALATEIFDRHGERIGEVSSQRRYYVALNQIPDSVIQAFLSAEDGDFFSHSGVSIKAIIRAAYANIRRGAIVQGGSTVTQQLARLYFLTPERTFKRKIKEAALALAIEERLSKKRILELYLNKIFLGNRSYGVEAAARNYFRKSVSELNVAEAAMLAGLPAAPSKYAPHRFFGRAKKRQEYVLRRMEKEGYLKPEERKRWLRHALVVASHPLKNVKTAPYFFSHLKEELGRMLAIADIDQKGLQIYTSLDAGMHKKLLKTFRAEIRQRYQKKFGSELQVALVLQDARTGGILALQGGEDFYHSQFNRATSAQRPLGSLFLPFYYSLALDRNYHLMSSLFRENKIVGDGPKRLVNKFDDLCLYEGLLGARTVESARLYSWLGMGTVDQFSRKVGFKFKHQDLSLALGSGKADLVTATSAFRIFANQGRYTQPFIVEMIRDRSGAILYERDPQVGVQAISQQTAFIMRETLQDVLKFGVGKSIQKQAKGLAAMLGTDMSLHDSWMVGASDSLVLGIWIGSEFGKNKLAKSQESLREVVSSVWASLMAELPDDGMVEKHIPPGVSFTRMTFKRSGVRQRTVSFHTEKM